MEISFSVVFVCINLFSTRMLAGYIFKYKSLPREMAHLKVKNRELKQRRRRRRRRRHQVKNEVIFYEPNSRLSRSLQFANRSKIVLKLNMQRRRSI